jgi:hypothetical protein
VASHNNNTSRNHKDQSKTNNNQPANNGNSTHRPIDTATNAHHRIRRRFFERRRKPARCGRSHVRIRHAFFEQAEKSRTNVVVIIRQIERNGMVFAYTYDYHPKVFEENGHPMEKRRRGERSGVASPVQK